MKYVYLLLLLSIISCKDGKKYHDANVVERTTNTSQKLNAIVKFQNELNEEFRDPEKSPLPDRYRKKFDGLNFYPADTNYVITAKFVRTPEALPFFMPTSTGRKSEETVYGIAHFSLNGITHQLEVYQNKELMLEEKYKDYLFLPFLDETNGEETYGGGRYIDLSIPEGDSIQIDFNKAYNPYCAYNKKYSCPIVPRVNSLDIKVMVGVKQFKK
ncbi:MAG: hypothetical protein COA50_02720 [Flavobacteriaceae bacterium]|nr:MAG: hypothetical protein COA50_02720 [Flavobacteriaceae bacterium]